MSDSYQWTTVEWTNTAESEWGLAQLVINDATCRPEITVVPIVRHYNLTVRDIVCVTTEDEPAPQYFELADADDIACVSALDEITLEDVVTMLTVYDGDLRVYVDVPDLVQQNLLDVNESDSESEAEGDIDVEQVYTLVVNGSDSVPYVDELTLTQQHLLAVNGSDSVSVGDEITTTVHFLLSQYSCDSLSYLDEISLVQQHQLGVNGADCLTSLEEVQFPAFGAEADCGIKSVTLNRSIGKS